MSATKMWRTCAWGDIAVLNYGRALRDYRDGRGTTEVFGTNGPVGSTEMPAMGNGPAVIVGRKGAYRGIHYAPRPFFVIDTAFWLEPTEPIDPRWAYYELKLHDINSMDSGSAIPSTSRDAFYQMPVLVPPLEEQHAIAATLGALDDKIDSNRRARTLARELGSALVTNATISGTSLTTELGSVTASIARGVSPQYADNDRTKIKRLLAKYKYPPDSQAKAVELVLEQAELIAGAARGGVEPPRDRLEGCCSIH